MVCIVIFLFQSLSKVPVYLLEKKITAIFNSVPNKSETFIIKIIQTDLVYLPSTQMGLAIPKVFMRSAHGKFSYRFLGVVFHYLTTLEFINIFLKSKVYLPNYNLNSLFLIFILIFFCFSHVRKLLKLLSGLPSYFLSRNKQAHSITTKCVILAVLSFILALVPSSQLLFGLFFLDAHVFQ